MVKEVLYTKQLTQLARAQAAWDAKLPQDDDARPQGLHNKRCDCPWCIKEREEEDE